MKNYSVILVVMLLVLITCQTCQKEPSSPPPPPPDPCENINCQNGGNCVDGTCQCPQYYTGPTCNDFKVPILVKAQSLQLSFIPKTCQTWDGSTWQNGLAPPRDADVYIQLYRNGSLYYDTRANYISDTDCLFEGDCYYYKPISLNPTQLYELRVYDRDSGNPDDLMGSYTFRPWDQMIKYKGSNFYPSTTRCEIFELEQSCSANNYSSSINFIVLIHDLQYVF